MSVPKHILRAIHEVWFGEPPDESSLHERESELVFVVKQMTRDDLARLESLCPDSRTLRPAEEPMPAIVAERIREIEERALEKMRKPGQAKEP